MGSYPRSILSWDTCLSWRRHEDYLKKPSARLDLVILPPSCMSPRCDCVPDCMSSSLVISPLVSFPPLMPCPYPAFLTFCFISTFPSFRPTPHLISTQPFSHFASPPVISTPLPVISLSPVIATPPLLHFDPRLISFRPPPVLRLSLLVFSTQPHCHFAPFLSFRLNPFLISPPFPSFLPPFLSFRPPSCHFAPFLSFRRTK